MPSLIHGYNYDIFISYRQKDNKGDKWVSEFVEALKTELESTFKEEISVYFDINPHDGLLETHDVDESLKEKLKCLIFIPIISRTYCDPKSFAWEHELIAFIEKASNDKFGLKVKLPDGNVASRILPVRIHDLYHADIKLCESVLGGFIRGVEFIYKEPGVNRPLRLNEENPHENLNHTIYRNQINKIALAIRDMIESMQLSDFSDIAKPKEILQEENKKKEKKKKVSITEESIRKETDKHKKEVRVVKTKPEEEKKLPILRRPGVLIPGIYIIITFLGLITFLLNRNAKIKWAKNEALTEIGQLIDRADFDGAYDLVQKAEKFISDEPKFQELSSKVMSIVTIITDPPDADVYIRKYSDIDGEWEKLGRTPVDNAKIAGSSFWMASAYYLIRIEKPGYEEVLATMSTEEDTLYRKLFEQGTIPPDMVYVEGDNGFFIDRYEVTNKQYKEFIDSGGYRNPDYWKNEFKIDSKTMGWDEAMSLFVDKSGRTGPATWEAGDYPDGDDNYPVTGISWYEAVAYAEYAGKDLPASDHWNMARGGIASYKIVPISNFDKVGPEPVGTNKGIGGFGTYDMAGNVREWCWNETPTGHIIRGGSWDDMSYFYNDLSQLPSFNRSPRNGFRCVKYIDKENFPESAFQLVNFSNRVDYSKSEPVPENIFMVYRNQFLYDNTDLQAVIEEKDSSNEDWTVEKITYNAAYENERVVAYLFLPKNVSPPFQTLIYVPGMGSFWRKDLLNDVETNWLIDYLLKDGRAVMCPVYKYMWDRIYKGPYPEVLGSHQLTEWVVKSVKDFSRSVDYLETRADIDTSKLGYYGYSLGGEMGGVIPAVEKRLKVNIVICGGFHEIFLPEVNALNYVSKVNIPTLMLNSRYDLAYLFDYQVKPFYDLLGTSEKDLILYETAAHYVPKNEMIKEVLAWLDKYLGPVK